MGNFTGGVLVASMLIGMGFFQQVKAADLTRETAKVAVIFSGGHETDPKDRGRPVILIAAALGVTPEVFREAFSQVHPAGPGKEPEPGQVRKNKSALMSTLGKHGATSERLDEVSSYYRYRPGGSELWPNQPAVAYALVKDGLIVGYELVSGGSGYSSMPLMSVPGFKDNRVTLVIAYGKSLESNGSIASIKVK